MWVWQLYDISFHSESCSRLVTFWLRRPNDRGVLTVSSGMSCLSPYKSGAPLGGSSREREERGHLGESIAVVGEGGAGTGLVAGLEFVCCIIFSQATGEGK